MPLRAGSRCEPYSWFPWFLRPWLSRDVIFLFETTPRILWHNMSRLLEERFAPWTQHRVRRMT